MPFKIIYDKPDKLILGQASAIGSMIAFIVAGLIFGGVGLFFTLNSGLGPALIFVILGIILVRAFFNHSHHLEKYVPEFICFNNETGLIEISTKNKASIIYIPYSQIDDFIITQKGGKNSVINVSLRRVDHSEWELFSIGHSASAQEKLELIRSKVHKHVAPTPIPAAVLPAFVTLTKENNSQLMTWKNRKVGHLVSLLLLGALVFSFFTFFLNTFIFSSATEISWAPLLITGFIALIFCIIAVYKLILFIKDQRFVYGLRIGENYVEYLELTNDGRVAKSLKFNDSEFYKLSTNFEFNTQEIGSLLLTHNGQEKPRTAVRLRYIDAGFIDALSIESWVDEQVRKVQS